MLCTCGGLEKIAVGDSSDYAKKLDGVGCIEKHLKEAKPRSIVSVR